MARPLTHILNDCKVSLDELVHYAQDVARAVSQKPQIRQVAHKVHSFVKENADLLFWGSHGVNFLLSPMSFTVGAATGAGMAIGYRLGMTDLNLGVVRNLTGKASFIYLNGVALFALGPVVRGFTSGFVAGDFIGRSYSKEDADELYHLFAQDS